MDLASGVLGPARRTFACGSTSRKVEFSTRHHFFNFNQKLNLFAKKRVQKDRRRVVLDPKSLVDTIVLPKTNHLRDSQLRRPSSSGAGSVPVFLAPNSKLLLRHIVSHDSNVNGHVANVTFERSRFESCSNGSQGSSEGYVALPVASGGHSHYPRALGGRRLAFLRLRAF